jgi:decaprenyl-phosphate phosphoribosyltransferase
MDFYACLKLLRVSHWLKNLMLFFPTFLGGSMLNPGNISKGYIPFAAFCLTSSGCYVLNDIFDAGSDANHPVKMKRPIASGAVSIRVASLIGILLVAAGILIALQVAKTFLVLLIIYVVITILYSIRLKEYPIIDIFCISAGFLLRLQAGGVVFNIDISEWLFLSVFLLSLFLSTGKRLCEKNSMGNNAGNHRKTLLTYPPGFLEGTLYMTGGTVLVTYTMYAISRQSLVFTVPLCCFGLLRYIFRVKSGLGGDPTESLLKDLPLFVVGLLWAGMVGWGIYGG